MDSFSGAQCSSSVQPGRGSEDRIHKAICQLQLRIDVDGLSSEDVPVYNALESVFVDASDFPVSCGVVSRGYLRYNPNLYSALLHHLWNRS